MHRDLEMMHRALDLLDGGQMWMTDIARALGVSQFDAVIVVAQLEHHGMVSWTTEDFDELCQLTPLAKCVWVI